jgi:hypothetical protein
LVYWRVIGKLILSHARCVLACLKTNFDGTMMINIDKHHILELVNKSKNTNILVGHKLTCWDRIVIYWRGEGKKHMFWDVLGHPCPFVFLAICLSEWRD